MISLLLALMLCVASVDAAAISLRSLVQQKDEDTVTISREEYESLLRFEKLDVLMQLVDMYYYEDVDEDDMLESAALGLISGIGCQLLADPSDQMITVTRVFKGSPA